MPYDTTKRTEGVIIRPGGRLLGTMADVQANLSTVFPEITFERLESGHETIAYIEAQGLDVIDADRRAMERVPVRTGGSFYHGDYNSVHFDLGPAEEVRYVLVSQYGEADDWRPFWRRLETKTRWSVMIHDWVVSIRPKHRDKLVLSACGSWPDPVG